MIPSTERLVLVQHCQSEHHVNGLTGGWTDTPLTPLGRRQAECLADRLKGMVAGEQVCLVCSDLKRAKETADVVAAALGVKAQPAPDLREFNNGIAAGMTREETKRHEAPIPSGGPGIDRRPFEGAETWREFYARVCRCMDSLLPTFAGVPIIVAHGGTLNNIVAWWLGLPADMLARVSFQPSPASISVLGVSKWGERAIKSLNDRSHLATIG